jgi:peptide/nickel transport system permease protein
VIAFILRRVAAGIALIFVVISLIFLAVRAVPGDPALLLAGGDSGDVSAESLDLIRERMGLDKPLLEQYLGFLGGILRGDLGQSFVGSGTDVTGLIASRLPYSLELIVLAAAIAIAVGIPLGSLAGRRPGRIDGSVSVFTSIGIAIPVYVLGALLIFFFALQLRWFPSGGAVPWTAGVWPHLRALVLPSIALAIAFAAVVARMTRSSVVEVSGQDWVRTALAKGLGRRTVFRRHVLRNSLTPVVTVIGLEIGTLIGASVMVERVFSYPGMSSLLIDSVLNRDYPVVQGVVIVVSVFFIVTNFVVDIVYGILDPRVRRS